MLTFVARCRLPRRAEAEEEAEAEDPMPAQHVASRICICPERTGVQPVWIRTRLRSHRHSPAVAMAAITLLQLNGVNSLIMQTAHIWLPCTMYLYELGCHVCLPVLSLRLGETLIKSGDSKFGIASILELAHKVLLDL